MEQVQPVRETPFPYTRSQNKRNRSLMLIIGAVVLLVVVILLGASFFTRQSNKTVEDKTVVSETPTPSPTEAPKIDKASVTIQVINGTGTPGQAGSVIKMLEEAGYSTDNIKSGNAEEFNNPSTTITAKENFDQIVNDIKDVLKSTFDEIVIGSPRLEADSKFDVVIMTGGKIFETPTPSASSSSSVSSAVPSPTITSTPSPTPKP